MAQLVVMYKTPKDAAAFDKHYAEKHIPMAKKIPGLRKYEVSKGPTTPAGPSAYHLIATLTFDDLGAIQKAFGSAEGKPPLSDVPDLRHRRRRDVHFRHQAGLRLGSSNQAIFRYPYSQAAIHVPSMPRTKPAEKTFRPCSRSIPACHEMPLSAARTITTPIA